MTLYEITDDIIRLYQMAEEDEIDAQMFSDTLEALESEFEDKADGYAKDIRTLEGDVTSLKAEIDRLTGRKKTIEGNIKNMKYALEMAMRASNKKKFKTTLFSFAIQKNPPSVVVDEQDIKCIPEEYLIAQEPKINRKLLYDELKAGVKLEGIAHLEQKETLRIR